MGLSPIGVSKRKYQGNGPPLDSNFSFYAVVGKFTKIIGWRPILWEIMDLPLSPTNAFRYMFKYMDQKAELSFIACKQQNMQVWDPPQLKKILGKISPVQSGVSVTLKNYRK